MLVNDRLNAFVVIMCNAFPPFLRVRRLRFSNLKTPRGYSAPE